jgi:hypothetical protein
MAIRFEIPVRTVSEANGREYWRRKAERTAKYRQAAMWVARSHGVRRPTGGATITLTRIAPRRLDDDNLRSALKAIRDGIADAMELDDGGPRLVWEYAQEKRRPREYSVMVSIENERR